MLYQTQLYFHSWSWKYYFLMFSIAADVKFWTKGLGTPHILRFWTKGLGTPHILKFSLAEGRIYETKWWFIPFIFPISILIFILHIAADLKFWTPGLGPHRHCDLCKYKSMMLNSKYFTISFAVFSQDLHIFRLLDPVIDPPHGGSTSFV